MPLFTMYAYAGVACAISVRSTLAVEQRILALASPREAGYQFRRVQQAVRPTSAT